MDIHYFTLSLKVFSRTNINASVDVFKEAIASTTTTTPTTTGTPPQRFPSQDNNRIGGSFLPPSRTNIRKDVDDRGKGVTADYRGQYRFLCLIKGSADKKITLYSSPLIVKKNNSTIFFFKYSLKFKKKFSKNFFWRVKDQ